MNDERLSADDGSYDVGVIHAPVTPEGKLTATKGGYAPFEKSFHSREELGTRVDIVLKPVPSSVPSR